MQHLDTERIAAFDHEPPSAEERAHLTMCARCRAEVDALAVLLQRAAGDGFARAAADGPPLTTWSTLSAALRAEGLLTSPAEPRHRDAPLVVRALDGSGGVHARAAVQQPADSGTDEAFANASNTRSDLSSSDLSSSERSSSKTDDWSTAGQTRAPAWQRVAAAMLLLLGGAAAGRMSARTEAWPMASRSGASPVARTAAGSDGDAASFSSVADATALLNHAQRDYERASLWLAANDTAVRGSDVYRARLAALDQMMAASRAALRDAPQDPVLNNYFLAASTAREATLRQLSGALPVDKTLEGY